MWPDRPGSWPEGFVRSPSDRDAALALAHLRTLPPRDLLDLSSEITQPLLVIHATPGQGGEKLSRDYYEAAKGPKEYWAAPGGHTGAINAEPKEYERRVVGFFDRTLLGR